MYPNQYNSSQYNPFQGFQNLQPQNQQVQNVSYNQQFQNPLLNPLIHDQNQNRPRFDPQEANLTPALRARIEGWANNVPKSQFQQYGPLTVYFCQKFPNALIKPQAKVRSMIEAEKANLLDRLLAGDIEGLTDEELEIAQTLKKSLDKGRLCKDSTAKDWVSNERNSGMTYPDFHICKFGGAVRPDGTERDIVRIVVEVGSIPRSQSESALNYAKEALLKQLMKSMQALDNGERWKDYALGVAIIGKEFAFIRRAYDDWRRCVDSEGTMWSSLFSDRWDKAMEELKPMFE